MTGDLAKGGFEKISNPPSNQSKNLAFQIPVIFVVLVEKRARTSV